MKIGLVLECGPDGPDLHVCRRMIRLLLPEAEVACVTMDNKPNLLSRCGDAVSVLIKQGCNRVIIVWDLYPAWREGGEKPCLCEDRRDIHRSLEQAGVDDNPVSLVCIHEELEAWLLADGRALSSFLSTTVRPVTIADQKNPDRLTDPKGRLIDLMRSNIGRKYEDYLHAKKIADRIADTTRLRRSKSFKRFAMKVADVEL